MNKAQTNSPPTTKLGDNHNRPDNWKTARFWQDVSRWHHPVSLDEPDQIPVHGKIPDWVYERRGLEPPAPDTPQSIEATLAEGYNLTDTGNSQRLAKYYGSDIHYCEEKRCWLVWDGRRWDRDYGTKINTLADFTVRKIYAEASAESDPQKRKELAIHGKNSENAFRLTATTLRAQHQPGIPIKANNLDSDPWLFNVLNGTINLKTGELLPHDRNDLLTTLVPIDYDPKAPCPMWLKFLEQTTNGDTELADYLQLVFGVCLTGDMLDQVFFYLFGLGQNGKTTLTDKLLEVTGDYGMRVDSEMFMAVDKSRGAATESIANIRGKRVIISSEVPEGRKLNTGLLKDLTGGGEAIRARRLYEHEIEFKPVCKIVMFGNYKPTITESTLALWRRLKLIPFLHTVSDADRDSFLGNKLSSELPGILAWAVRGCLNWQAVRFLDEPLAITTATREYQSDEDLLADFLSDQCELGPELSIDQASLKKAYHEWSTENSTMPLGPKKFASRLTSKHCRKTPTKNVRSWVGITLKNQGVMNETHTKIQK